MPLQWTTIGSVNQLSSCAELTCRNKHHWRTRLAHTTSNAVIGNAKQLASWEQHSVVGFLARLLHCILLCEQDRLVSDNLQKKNARICNRGSFVDVVRTWKSSRLRCTFATCLLLVHSVIWTGILITEWTLPYGWSSVFGLPHNAAVPFVVVIGCEF